MDQKRIKRARIQLILCVPVEGGSNIYTEVQPRSNFNKMERLQVLSLIELWSQPRQRSTDEGGK